MTDHERECVEWIGKILVALLGTEPEPVLRLHEEGRRILERSEGWA